MKTSLSQESVEALSAGLARATRARAAWHPGDTDVRQPVHTVYGGAHVFRSDSAARLGAAALKALEDYAPGASTFAKALGIGAGSDAKRSAGGELRARSPSSTTALADLVYARMLDKLRREPVEDFRIDFEDGYGTRADAEEDGHAVAAAREVASGLGAGVLPPFIGIRLKSFSDECRSRSIRTLDLFLTTLTDETAGRLPPNFVVTLPKVTMPEQVELLADLLDRLEPALGLPGGSLRLEVMVETTQAILNDRGESTLPHLVAAARGRCVAAHFGTYDYTAACNITAAHQHMLHPACGFAKHMMQVALAGTGVWLSDGATNIMPVPPHRTVEGGPPLTARQIAENRSAVHRAWKLHYDHVWHSLTGAFYQGWDLHPAQLPTRYAAVYTFFLEGLDAASERLRNFVGKAAQATLVGEVFDDAATGQGLLNYFLRAVNCGAIAEDEAMAKSGLTLAELRGRSFARILEGRRQNSPAPNP